ncbi:MAG: gas vesicle protein GvpN, partial [Sphingomonadales bacterium]|nr:gas vesicle protein GvpN [Sphingomonadales bacterium]
MSTAVRSENFEGITTLMPRARTDFVQTENVKSVTKRALAYLNAGYSVHFRGPAGTGKTTLALHTASLLDRPAVMIVGDEEMVTSNLVGAEHGYNYRKVVDRFIHTVTRIEESAGKRWTDHRLTTACREGFTLIYDEFTRSRAEANNVLLGVLEEGLLVLPAQNQDEPYIKVHPDFRAIFTSNPQEYAGVHEAQ